MEPASTNSSNGRRCREPRCSRSSPARRPGRFHRASFPAPAVTRKRAAHLPVSGAAATAWKSFLEQAVLRYGPVGSFWVTHPALPERPIRTWQIWNEENFKYFVAKPNPAEYGKLVKLSYTAIKSERSGRQDHPRRNVREAQGRSVPEGQRQEEEARQSDQPELLRQLLPRTDVQAQPGDQGEVQRRRAAPVHPRLQVPGGRDRRIPQGSDPQRGRRQGALDHRARLELRTDPNPAVDLFAKGVSRPGQGTEGRLLAAFAPCRRNGSCSASTGSRSTTQPGACNFCGGSGLFAEGFEPKKAWYEYVKFAGGTP